MDKLDLDDYLTRMRLRPAQPRVRALVLAAGPVAQVYALSPSAIGARPRHMLACLP